MKACWALVAAAALVACGPTSVDVSRPAPPTMKEGTRAGLGGGFTEQDCKGPGAFVPSFQNASPELVALDAFCGNLLAKRAAPDGWVAVLGSSRLAEGTPEYQNARTFASLWTHAHSRHPIATGGGPGIMEAANRGAKEAGGTSIGLATYFSASTDTPNAFVTQGHLFSDLDTRERALVIHASAVVVYGGGVGTAWELFMVLSSVQAKRHEKMPVILVGKDWTDALKPYLEHIVTKKTASAEDVASPTIVETPEQAVAALEAQLARP